MENDMHLLKLESVYIPRVRPNAGGSAWVKYGSDNLYPQQLIDCKSYSATHQAILNLKTDLITGEGFLQSADKGSSAAVPSTDLLRRLASDYALFNGFAIQVIWSRDGKRIAEYRHLNFSTLRMALPAPGMQPDTWYYSRNWEAWEKESDPSCRPLEMPAFNPAESKIEPRQVYVFAEYAPEVEHYPIAAYNSALPDIMFDFEYGRFKLNSMRNGMFPTLHIEVQGQPTSEEKDNFYRSLKKKFSGTEQAAEVLITYGIEGAGKTTVTPIEVRGNADMFREWEAQSVQRIISAHRLSSPVLAGLPGRAGLGANGSEIAVAYEHFYNTVIRPMQINICASLEGLLAYSGKQPAALVIANSKPIRFVFTENVLEKILTRDEMREEIGFGPMQTGTAAVE